MKRGCGLVALLAMLAAGEEVHAQLPVFFPTGGGFYGSSLSVTRVGRNRSVSLTVGSYGPYNPYGFGMYSSTLLYVSPPPIIVTQPIVITQPIVMAPPEPEREVFVIRPRQRGAREALPDGQLPAEMPGRPLPGAPAGGFRPVLPEDRARALAPAPREDPPPRLPRPPAPEPDPKIENARQAKLGKQAFAKEEYARAAERFRQATAVMPQEPETHFLLAQAYFATGKYREAVAAIQEGLRWQPAWPTAKFQPRDLYGANAAEFTDHLKALEEAAQRLPNDPVLLFLLGYQLWFDGRQDEARRLFERAARLVADPAHIEPFLRAKPAMRVVAK